MKLILPYIFALVVWVVYFSIIGWPKGYFFILPGFVLFYFIVVLLIGGRRFYKHWIVWLNYLIYFLSSFFFLLLINTSLSRTIYGIVFGLISGFIIYSLQQFFSNKHVTLAAKNYLELNHFIYFLTFWQLSALAFFALIFISTLVWPWVLVLIVVTFLLTTDIVGIEGLRKSSTPLVLIVTALTTVELFIFVRLLPVHFYVAATILTLWYFFVVDIVLAGQELTSRRRLFRRRGFALLIIILVILLTSIFK